MKCAEIEPCITEPGKHSLEENMICSEFYRITMITERLIRFEYSESGVFEDRLTAKVMNRNLGKTEYSVAEKKGELVVNTKYLCIHYDGRPFTRSGLSVKLTSAVGNYGAIWNYGMQVDTLKGTARTLDGVDGACRLQEGLIARTGITVLEDSDSLIFLQNGWVGTRSHKETDFYVFAYGHDYLSCLHDFFKLCGTPPLLPRYTLGNWWSRYYKYSEESYKELINRFERQGIPFSVAVIDMDWHITNPDSRYGSGWTGYTWNEELFPDPKRFLTWLHEKGLHVTLNDHPADGIRAFEKCYEKVAKRMGINPETEAAVECDVTDKDFVQVWFEEVLHPIEQQGVDFWWIDWQQGSVCAMEGMDPLWMQNYVHIQDKEKRKQRPFILSRYADIGSHRFPVGFSGDTIISWDSLRFQPYFTSTASNVGYCWWSHDIGGHMQGYKDDELSGRWLQFGVFSPICRLHSSDNPFSGKEPWNYRMDVEKMMTDFLRLRHQMIPYLYTMNHLCQQGIPFIQPMYYKEPEQQEAYEVFNQYYFGTEMIVAPITEPADLKTHKAGVTVWLPEGIWYDFFTKRKYKGNRMVQMYRGIESIPVLVKAGSILPMTKKIAAEDISQNQKTLWLKVYHGNYGEFELYEDDNQTCSYAQGDFVTTTFEWKQSDGKNQCEFLIHAATGNRTLIPQTRSYEIEFVDVNVEAVACEIDGVPVEAEFCQQEQTLYLKEVATSKNIRVLIKEEKSIPAGEEQESGIDISELYELLNQTECDFQVKDQIYSAAKRNSNVDFLKELLIMKLDGNLYGCIAELVS